MPATTFIVPRRFAAAVRVRELHLAILDLIRGWTRIGGEREAVAWGEVLRNERYPLVHMANLAWADATPPGGPREILGALERAYLGTDVRHRHVLFADAMRAYEAQDAFGSLGFQPTAELALAKVGLPVCIANPDVDVREVGDGADEAEFRTVTLAVHTDLGYTPEESMQVYELDRVRAEAIGERRYLAFLRGEPAGTFTLWPRGRFALIGNVGTVPRHRMRGVARTMIFQACSRAVDLHFEYVLLTAALLGTPRVMYETLGFRPVGA